MSRFINNAAVENMVCRVLEEDINECLEKTTERVVDELKNQVRANVAARMIALAKSDYSLEYMRNELRIVVKMETN